ncbi:Fe-S cluster assembly protein SufB [Candidatus Micrarchaeota archaeon]|nr:Fe-S cluster assembly protein SufB [Candidatus Micrarchaeota archaeon]
MEKGLSKKKIREISAIKNEPEWMLEKRLGAYNIFIGKKIPEWGPDLSELDFGEIVYYIKGEKRKATDWKNVPEKIKKQFEELGIPKAEKKLLGGSLAHYESTAVYEQLKKRWEKQGVIFTDMDSALKKYPEMVKKYFGKLVPPSDNKFSALNTAVWSGGTFIYIPKNTKVEAPLQTYFKMNTQNMGQFERTLIIADEGAEVHYIEGCSAPTYSTASLHAAVVEVFASKNSKVRYTTIQNWSTNVYNLATKRAFAEENAYIEWMDGNIGSKVNMKYPSVLLSGKGAKCEMLSIGYAGGGQIQDTGGKIFHLAPETHSSITSKSISKDGGTANYRGIIDATKDAEGIVSSVRCDGIVLDEKSHSNTYPKIKAKGKKASVSHEASVGKISEESIFYLMSRGFSRDEAHRMLVIGFAEEFIKKLPFEYAVEINKLLDMEVGEK